MATPQERQAPPLTPSNDITGFPDMFGTPPILLPPRTAWPIVPDPFSASRPRASHGVHNFRRMHESRHLLLPESPIRADDKSERHDAQEDGCLQHGAMVNRGGVVL